MHVFLVVIPLLTIYIGSHLSLHVEEEQEEYITLQESMMFPIIASISLLSLYLAIQYFENFIQYFMTGYVFFVGTGSLYFALSHTVYLTQSFRLRLDYQKKSLVDVKWTLGQVITLLLSLVILSIYFSTKNWILSNVIAFSFCIVALRTMKLDTIVTGIVLLAALFFYDIFWVFKTPVMVTVAQKLDYPLKLLVPRVLSVDMMYAKEFALLGLGDIVIPGFFVATCLRFDIHSNLDNCSPKTVKRYFYTCLVFYTVALVGAMAASQYFQSPQPALLYISPCCILSVVVLSLLRGELRQMMSFSAKPSKDEIEVTTNEKEGLEQLHSHQVVKGVEMDSRAPRKQKITDTIDRVLRPRTPMKQK